jgi:hypothetical protein
MLQKLSRPISKHQTHVFRLPLCSSGESFGYRSRGPRFDCSALTDFLWTSGFTQSVEDNSWATCMKSSVSGVGNWDSLRTRWTDDATLSTRQKLAVTFVVEGCRVVSPTDPHICFLDWGRYFVIQVALQLSSRGRADHVPDPLLNQKFWWRRESNPEPLDM